MTAPFIEGDVAGASTDPEPPDQSDRVLLGVAALIADALDVDALWVRVAFVLLGLAGGVGLVLYLGLWLALIGPESIDDRWSSFLGGVIVVAGVPLMIANADVEFATGPLVVLALLIALAVVLWQPRVDRPERSATSRRPLPPPMRERAAASTTDDDLVSAEPAALVTTMDAEVAGAPPTPTSAVPSRRRPRRPRREPSVLGRWTLASAIIVAGAGALVDQLNAGRMYPEQWLGAAAAVCGLGLLVGAVRGHARWLIVPALVLAAAGYGAGVLARVGIGAGDAFGDGTINIVEDTPGGEMSTSIGAGQVWVRVDGIPDGIVTVDARVGFGTIDINATSDVAVEVRTEIDSGEARLDGQSQDGDTLRLGPDREPDVIVLARVGVGQVNLSSYDITETLAPPVAVPATPATPAAPGSASSPTTTFAPPSTTVLDQTNTTIGG